MDLSIILVPFHIIICIALVLAVLMQSAKGEGLAGGGTAFGGGVSGAVFGGRGAGSFLSKATTVLAVIFFLNCGALALVFKSGGSATAGGENTTTQSSDLSRRAGDATQQTSDNAPVGQPSGFEDSLARVTAEGERPLTLDSLQVGTSTEPETGSDNNTGGN